ncbi:MAG: hypothetical protein CMJ19_03975 [Phycisphaeraceae bacterium]|nr:hypothetical protein [Phycisphaeraceae bacterium]
MYGSNPLAVDCVGAKDYKPIRQSGENHTQMPILATIFSGDCSFVMKLARTGKTDTGARSATPLPIVFLGDTLF